MVPEPVLHLVTRRLRACGHVGPANIGLNVTGRYGGI